MTIGFTFRGRFVPIPDRISRFVMGRLFFPLSLAHRGVTLGVQLVVRNEAGHVLLVRQSYTTGWQFPGGGVDRGETLAEAGTRELFEETRVEAEEPPSLFGFYANFTTSRLDQIALMTVPRWRVDAFPPPNREIVAIQFFDPEALPADARPSVSARLDELAGRAPISPHW